MTWLIPTDAYAPTTCRSSSRLWLAAVRWAIGRSVVCSAICWVALTVRSRVEPEAPYVTETKSGPSDSSSRIVVQSWRCCSASRAGKSSNDTSGRSPASRSCGHRRCAARAGGPRARGDDSRPRHGDHDRCASRSPVRTLLGVGRPAAASRASGVGRRAGRSSTRRDPLGAAFRRAVSTGSRAFVERQAPALEAMGPELAAVQAMAAELLAGGKRLRPAFFVWGYVAAGGLPDATPPWRRCSTRPRASTCCTRARSCTTTSWTPPTCAAASPPRTAASRRCTAGRAGSGDGPAFGRAGAILLGDLLIMWSAQLLGEAAAARRGARPRAAARRPDAHRGHLRAVPRHGRPGPAAPPLAARGGRAPRARAARSPTRTASPSTRPPATPSSGPCRPARPWAAPTRGCWPSCSRTGRRWAGPSSSATTCSGCSATRRSRASPPATTCARASAPCWSPRRTPAPTTPGAGSWWTCSATPTSDADGVARLQDVITGSGATAEVEATITEAHDRALAALDDADVTDEGRTALRTLGRRGGPPDGLSRSRSGTRLPPESAGGRRGPRARAPVDADAISTPGAEPGRPARRPWSAPGGRAAEDRPTYDLVHRGDEPADVGPRGRRSRLTHVGEGEAGGAEDLVEVGEAGGPGRRRSPSTSRPVAGSIGRCPDAGSAVARSERRRGIAARGAGAPGGGRRCEVTIGGITVDGRGRGRGPRVDRVAQHDQQRHATQDGQVASTGTPSALLRPGGAHPRSSSALPDLRRRSRVGTRSPSTKTASKTSGGGRLRGASTRTTSRRSSSRRPRGHGRRRRVGRVSVASRSAYAWPAEMDLMARARRACGCGDRWADLGPDALDARAATAARARSGQRRRGSSGGPVPVTRNRCRRRRRAGPRTASRRRRPARRGPPSRPAHRSGRARAYAVQPARTSAVGPARSPSTSSSASRLRPNQPGSPSASASPSQSPSSVVAGGTRRDAPPAPGQLGRRPRPPGPAPGAPRPGARRPTRGGRPRSLTASPGRT